jgi:flagellar biogenesis protein FliO
MTLLSFQVSQAQDNAIGEIPFKQDDVYSYGFLGRIILVTLICLALAVAVVWVLRRMLVRGAIGPAGTGESIKLSDYRRLTPKMSVYVLEIDQQRVAVVQSGEALVHIPLEARND